MSRFWNQWAGSGSIPPNNVVTELAIAGPSYRFTSQAQIWRLLGARAHWTLPANPGNTSFFNTGYLGVTLNPNDPGRPNIVIRLPIAPSGDSANSYLEGTGSQNAIDFKRLEVRADDWPNAGGITLFQNSAGGFSIALSFHFFLQNGDPVNPLTWAFAGDVLADIVDLTLLEG